VTRQKRHSGRGRTSPDLPWGALAIIITIMVLELRVPAGPRLHTTGVGLLTYLLSFVYVAIYWNNHHHMFHLVKRASGAVLWANLSALEFDRSGHAGVAIAIARFVGAAIMWIVPDRRIDRIVRHDQTPD
jgi:Endosomal/lysosomal potassium channel TMEM175